MFPANVEQKSPNLSRLLKFCVSFAPNARQGEQELPTTGVLSGQQGMYMPQPALASEALAKLMKIDAISFKTRLESKCDFFMVRIA